MALPQTALKSQPAPRVESKTACGQTAGEIKADIDPLQAYKKTVDLWLWLDIFRGQQTSVSRAKRVITKYKKALGDPVGLAVALVFYCERAAGFCQDVQHQDTAYFDALVRMFEQALKARANLTGNVQNGFLTRLERVRSVGHQLGYGVGNNMDVLVFRAFSISAKQYRWK